MKKSISVLCIVLMLAGLLAGCISTAPEITVTNLVSGETESYMLGVGETAMLNYNMAAQVRMTKDAAPIALTLAVSDAGTFDRPTDADENMNAVYDTLVALAPSYASEDEAVATADANGLITAVAPGITTITVSVDNPGSDEPVTMSIPVEVVQYVEQLSVDADLLELTYIEESEGAEPDSTLANAAQIKAVVTPTDASDKSIFFASSDTSIATVDDEGVVVAAGVGECEITVSASGGKEDLEQIVKVVVGVPIPEIFELAINAQQNIVRGKGFQIQFNFGEDADPESYNVLYSSSDETVAVVTETGWVDCIGVGQAEVTAEIPYTDLRVTITLVVQKPVTSGTGGNNGSGGNNGTGGSSNGGGTAGGDAGNSAGDEGGNTGGGGDPAPAPAPAPTPSLSAEQAAAAARNAAAGRFKAVSGSYNLSGSYAGASSGLFSSQAEFDAWACAYVDAYAGLKGVLEYGTLYAFTDGNVCYICIGFDGDGEIETAW